MERRIKLKPCRVCGKVPQMGYCLGEYFVFGEDLRCSECGIEYGETHSTEQEMAKAWNGRD